MSSHSDEACCELNIPMLTAAQYTSSKVVSLPFTQHLIPRWSGCATAAYAKERKNRVAATDVDDILHQYQDYADSMIHDHHELFTSFSPCVSRLDTLMVNTMSRNDSYCKVVKMLLVLSHGQATVE